MFVGSNLLKRNGAISRTKKEENIDKNLLSAEDYTETISSSQELISSPRTPRTLIMGGLNDRFKDVKGELMDVLREVCRQVIDLKEEKELEKVKERIENLLLENQKLKEEVIFLRQENTNLKKENSDKDRECQKLVQEKLVLERKVEKLKKERKIAKETKNSKKIDELQNQIEVNFNLK